MASSTILDSPLGLFICAAVAGISLHLGVFIRGEWETYVLQLTTAQLLGPFLILVSLSSLDGLHQGASTTMVLMAGFHVGLYGSITIYRLFFHPLRHFYGPTGAKLTALWSSIKSIPDLKLYLIHQRLHEEHGDFIRIRPREISTNNAEAIQQIYGHSSKCTKAPFYDLNYPARSLQMTRDKKFHSQRRRIWDKAFNTNALKDYERRLMVHFQDLSALITASEGKPMNATDLCEYWGFDVMGDLMFGRSFGMLKDNKPHYALNLLRKSQATNLPFVSTIRSDWLNWCKAHLQERQKNIPQVSDLFSYVLGENKDESNEKTGNVLSALDDDDAVSDSELAIIAGSDTSSASLAAIIYLLAKHPDVQRRLQQEVDDAISSGGFSHQALTNKPLLEGVINEALRLYTPVPTGLQRLTPPEGLDISGRFIPGDTIVSVPNWTIQRDPRNFAQPRDFIPERWFSRPELVLRREAFSPFSTGPYSCVGKLLAMMELRLTVAQVVSKFEITLEDEMESVKLFEESPGWQDAFVAKVPPVRVCFRARQ